MKKKILNEVTSFCNECSSKECCPENECVLYRVEQVALNKKKVYQVEITETLQRVVEVEADSEQDAIFMVDDKYREEEIVLDAADFIDYEIAIFKSDEDEE